MTSERNRPFVGAQKLCLHAPELVFQYVLKCLHAHFMDAIFQPQNCKVSIPKIFNLNDKFNFKELPVRAVMSAHWSGPLVAAR